MPSEHPDERHHDTPCCPEVPELRRLRYFYGQMLDHQDLQDEQTYFREKLRLAHRCLHGHGVLCGLRVVPEPADPPCDPADERKRRELERRLEELEIYCAELEERLDSVEEKGEEAEEVAEELAKCRGRAEEVRRLIDELCPPGDEDDRPARLRIECGIAIDCRGDEIVLRRPWPFDSWQALSPADRRRAKEAAEAGEELTLYVSLCYCEQPVKPVRPVGSEPCAPAEGCRHAQLQDSHRLVVSLDEPAADGRCEPCCCGCDDPCVLLARIDGFVPRRPILEEQIANGARRRFGLYDWTTVTGIGWVHGGTYGDDQAAAVLARGEESGGFEIRFSRPVRTSTLNPGVVMVTVYEGYAGGRGRSSGLYHVVGTLDAPDGETTDRVVWRQTSDDRFHDGDMVLVQIKTEFILDECCRPVDGEHVGGRVPLVTDDPEGHPERADDSCGEPPDHPGPWTSGNGRGGGSFETWIFIENAGSTS